MDIYLVMSEYQDEIYPVIAFLSEQEAQDYIKELAINKETCYWVACIWLEGMMDNIYAI
jgi:hypothetical protein